MCMIKINRPIYSLLLIFKTIVNFVFNLNDTFSKNFNDNNTPIVMINCQIFIVPTCTVVLHLQNLLHINMSLPPDTVETAGASTSIKIILQRAVPMR